MTSQTTNQEHGFGRLIRPDVRDLQYLARLYLDTVGPPALPSQRFYKIAPVLDQGATPQCVGYAWRQWLSSAPLMDKGQDPAPDYIYAQAQTLDDFPGTDYDGTTVRAGVRVLQAFGHVKQYRWAMTIADIREWVLGGQGCVVMGTNWHEGMMTPKGPGHLLRATGPVIGGHAWLVYGYNSATDLYRMVNSWGYAWGDKGRAWIPGAELALLLSNDGEACCAIER